MLAVNPALGLRFLETEARELAKADDKYVRTVTRTAKIRLLHILMVLYERFGRTTNDGEAILELPLSRKDLGALTGITPETISRTIQKIENEAIARFDDRTVVFKDMEALFDEIDTAS
jgi:CRP-like cAMP-binding protein